MAGTSLAKGGPISLVTLGDSILDCAGYNPYGVHPAALLLKNDDILFPEFKGAISRPWDRTGSSIGPSTGLVFPTCSISCAG